MNNNDLNQNAASDNILNNDEYQLPELDEIIPVLEESIPELNEQVKISISESDSMRTEELDQQQKDLELLAMEQEINRPSIQESSIDEDISEENINALATDTDLSIEPIISEEELLQEQLSIERKAEVQSRKELILENSWNKVEMLLMENLPPQLSGAFLELLNAQVYDNKQQIYDEISLLDEDIFIELLEELGLDQGF
jgi:hypothetical protein